MKHDDVTLLCYVSQYYHPVYSLLIVNSFVQCIKCSALVNEVQCSSALFSAVL